MVSKPIIKFMKVLIVSISGDVSTNYVMDWISFLGYRPIRFNVDADVDKNHFLVSHEIGMETSETILKNEENIFKINGINSIWFRKFTRPNLSKSFPENSKKNIEIEGILKHINKEFFAGLFAIFDTWSTEKKVLGARITNQPSKMKMLLAAKQLKIDIPNTLITTKKSQLVKFLKKHENVITKPIRDGDMFFRVDENSNKEMTCMFTELIKKDELSKISNTFFPSLFQEALQKEIEIRTFYLDGKCYSMAIFSQLDHQTMVDFRMYNNENGNRNLPYKLPENLELKIKKLMKSLELNTGSIDIIKTKDGRFVFLEVNPWGQYGMVSDPCNYNLDEKIAKYLVNT
jgi:ATP-GRASP peptide maturase of grasp-with-spasm system